MIEMNSIDKQDIKNELFTLTALFRDHLNSSKVLSQTSLDIVSYINDYIQQHEFGIAFETLCTDLFEYDVTITLDEYKRLELTGQKLFPKDNSKWEHLKPLVQP
jgi:hypothetical protein